MNPLDPRYLEDEEHIRRARERRLQVLKELKEEMEMEPPRPLYPPAEDLIREDRER